MSFLINNMGWFFCIAIVGILALIGYKADSKEKQSNDSPKYIPNKENTNEKIKEETTDDFYYNPIQENKNDNNFEYNLDNSKQKENKTIDNNNNKIEEGMADLYEPLEPIQNTQKIEQEQKTIQETNNEIISDYVTNDIKTEEPEQITANVNNIENLNISLEDLENKNYKNLLSKINKSEMNTQENKQLNDQDDIQTNNETTLENNNTEAINTTSSENVQENPSQEETTEEDINYEHQFENEIQIEQNEQENNDIQEQNNEETNQTLDTSQENESQIVENNQIDQFEFNKEKPSYDGAIPEIFTNIEQNNETINHLENTNIEQENDTNLYNNSMDDDIWKF